jgi:PAS domain S-box-containing protein
MPPKITDRPQGVRDRLGSPSLSTPMPVSPTRTPFKRLSLRFVLVVPFVLQISVAVGLTGYLSLRNGQEAVNRVAQQLRSETSQRVGQHLDTYLTTPNQINQINAQAIDLGMLNVKNFAQTGRYFFRQMQTFNVGYVSFANPAGDLIGIQRSGQSLLITETKNGQLYYYNTNDQGDRLGTTQVNAYDPRTESWYSDAVQAKRPQWSHIYQWVDQPEILSISANYPVYDHDRLIGVLSVDHLLTQISDFLTQLNVSRSGKILILERDGKLVAGSSLNPFVINQGQAERIQTATSADLLTRTTTQFLLTKFGDLTKIQQTQQLEFNLPDGTRQFLQVTPWKDRYGLDWLIIVVVPEAEFMGQIQENTKTTVQLCLLALVAAIAFGLVTSRWITQPIFQLNWAAKEIAHGNLAQTVPVKNIRELTLLAASFNQMAAQLQASFTLLENQNQVLETRVADRTADLAQAEIESRLLLEELSQSRHFLNSIVENIPLALFVKDVRREFRYVLWNRAAEQMYSCSRDQAIGFNSYDWLDTATADRFLQEDLAVIERHDSTFIEDTFPHASGETIHQRMIKVPLFSATGEPTHILCIGENITDRKRLETTLRESAAQLRKQNKVLMKLTRNKSLSQGNLAAALMAITKATATLLEVSRVSVWLYDEAQTKIVCVKLYDYDRQTYTAGTELHAADYPTYFAALQTGEAIVATHAPTAACTRELHETYLAPAQIVAMLDVPISLEGKTAGVVCLEHRHTQREWTLEEESFVRSIADLVALALEARDRTRAETALRIEQEKSEQLLLNILPAPIAQQLKQNRNPIAQHFDEVTILFADIVGFTPLSARLQPIALVNLLNQIFSEFDALAERLGLEKIKTIGDAYMVAAGLPTPRADHAVAIAEMALAMQQAAANFRGETGERFQIRIGINTGVVVAGVIGTKKFIYDLWGDAVNVASRMESSGEPGNIQVTASTYSRIKDDFILQARGAITVKGKGEMQTYWLTGKRCEVRINQIA